jgi:hypothetical protein
MTTSNLTLILYPGCVQFIESCSVAEVLASDGSIQVKNGTNFICTG